MAIRIETDARDTQLRLFKTQAEGMRNLLRRLDAYLSDHGASGNEEVALKNEIATMLRPDPRLT
jgi:hypothetical protein